VTGPRGPRSATGALRLFAGHGPDAVSVRQVAAAAGVSPGLVIHHFGSGDGLREAAGAHVLALSGAMPGRAALDAMAGAGLAGRGADPAVRAAILMSSDLAVLLLREPLAGVLGEDPLSAAGMARWGREMLAIYAAGLMTVPPGNEGPEGEGER